MRPGASFESSMSSASATTKPPPSPLGSPEVQPHYGWHSPVPYLFGGLAAMLGLIALALLILACSYWKLSGYLDGPSAHRADQDPPSPNMKPVSGEKAAPLPVFKQQMVVIMAGDVKPTFLATPVSCNFTSSTFENKKQSSNNAIDDGNEEEEGKIRNTSVEEQ